MKRSNHSGCSDDTSVCMVQLYLGDDVFLGCWCRLSAHKHSVVWVAALAAALQELLKGPQPATHQVDVLKECKQKHTI